MLKTVAIRLIKTSKAGNKTTLKPLQKSKLIAQTSFKTKKANFTKQRKNRGRKKILKKANKVTKILFLVNNCLLCKGIQNTNNG